MADLGAQLDSLAASVPSGTSDAVKAGAETLKTNGLPPAPSVVAAPPAAAPDYAAPAGSSTTKAHLFGRTKSVYELLGSGPVGDILLWKKWQYSAGILGGATIIWVLFERSGYTLLTLLANIALVLVSGLFVWAQAAPLLNRAPPPLPTLQLSEDLVQNTAALIRTEVNKVLAIAHDIALGKDYLLFFKVLAGLYVISVVGAWFNSLTLVYIGILLAFSVPFLYDKYEDVIDKHGSVAVDKAGEYYKIVDEKVISKIPKASTLQKKVQ